MLTVWILQNSMVKKTKQLTRSHRSKRWRVFTDNRNYSPLSIVRMQKYTFSCDVEWCVPSRSSLSGVSLKEIAQYEILQFESRELHWISTYSYRQRWNANALNIEKLNKSRRIGCFLHNRVAINFQEIDTYIAKCLSGCIRNHNM